MASLFLSATAALTFLLAANSVEAQTCISLATSKQCPQYSAYSIQSFQGVNSAADFDGYVSSNAAFNFPTCSAWSSANGFPLRYSETFVCGWAVFYSTSQATTNKCNQNIPAPTNICQSSLTATIQDAKAQLSKVGCSNVPFFPQYNQYVQGAATNNCWLGVGNDINLKCGFSNATLATAHCKSSPTDPCCTATGNLIGSATPTATTSSSGSAAATSSAPPSINPNINGTSTMSDAPLATGASTNSTAANAAPAAAAATTASSSSSSGGGVNPLLIGAGALGVALIAVLASVLFFMTKKGQLNNNNSSTIKNGASDNMDYNSAAPVMAGGAIGGAAGNEGGADTMECVFEYKANLFDELSLDVGDEVQVLSKFDDGWALGLNLSTGKEGTFPLACLAPFGAGSEYGRDSRIDSQYSKRASSMFASQNDNRMTFDTNN